APGFRLLALFRNENTAVALFDFPAIDRAQGRRMQGFTAAQIRARMMPGAAYRLSVHDAVGERPVIMGAMGGDREQLRTGAHEQHLLAANMAEQPVIDEIGRCNALAEIGAAGRSLVLGHGRLTAPS